MKITPSGRKSAFSIIELLATVAVLAILVALLMPVTSGVRAKALTAKCAGNLRSWMTALNLYVSDHNGTLPPSAWHSGSTNDASTFLWPYLQARSKSDAWDRYFCPVKQTGEGNRTQLWGTYGFNAFVSEMPVVAIPQPSRLIYAMDLASGGRWISYSVIFGGKPLDLTQAVPKPHAKRVNVAYLDGHIAPALVSQLPIADFVRGSVYYSQAGETTPVASAAYDR